jgi:hypothetical protein
LRGPRGGAAQVVGLGGLEPPTSRLSGARSSQLSYRPKAVLALHEGRCVFDFPYGSSHLKERALGPSKPNSKPKRPT